MSRKSFSAAWRANYLKDLDSFLTVVEWDLFEDWERNAMPDGTAERQLVCALEVSYGGDTRGLAVRFLQRAVSVVERTLREGKLTVGYCQRGYPRNRGSLLRTRVYASGLLGAPLDIDGLRQAAMDYEAWAREFKRWDSLEQAYHLGAVRMSLIAGDLDNARRLIATRKSLKWHEREAALLRCIAKGGEGIRADTSCWAGFAAYFDEMRDPALKPTVFIESYILPFELGLIGDKYFLSPEGRIDFGRVIHALSA